MPLSIHLWQCRCLYLLNAVVGNPYQPSLVQIAYGLLVGSFAYTELLLYVGGVALVTKAAAASLRLKVSQETCREILCMLSAALLQCTVNLTVLTQL